VRTDQWLGVVSHFISLEKLCSVIMASPNILSLLLNSLLKSTPTSLHVYAPSNNEKWSSDLGGNLLGGLSTQIGKGALRPKQHGLGIGAPIRLPVVTPTE